jgi:hypothetical protein
MAASNLTAEFLRELLSYDPDTGFFYNRQYRGPKSPVGGKAGTVNAVGYSQIRVIGKIHLSHRLAWLYVYGTFPEGNIDHVNRDKLDNRICNLREANKSENSQNKSLPQSNNTHGFLGVTRDSGRWAARITTNGKTKYIGLFDTPEIAHAAYLCEKRKAHPFAPS